MSEMYPFQIQGYQWQDVSRYREVSLNISTTCNYLDLWMLAIQGSYLSMTSALESKSTYVPFVPYMYIVYDRNIVDYGVKHQRN